MIIVLIYSALPINQYPKFIFLLVKLSYEVCWILIPDISTIVLMEIWNRNCFSNTWTPYFNPSIRMLQRWKYVVTIIIHLYNIYIKSYIIISDILKSSIIYHGENSA